MFKLDIKYYIPKCSEFNEERNKNEDILVTLKNTRMLVLFVSKKIKRPKMVSKIY